MNYLLEVDNLRTYYYSKKRIVPAVDGVSFHLEKGEVLGLVGESGCGKSTVVRAITGLIDPTYARVEEGTALFCGADLLKMKEKELSKIRGKEISMVFQNPLSALNPVYTIGNQLTEALTTHFSVSRKEAQDRAVELLRLVHIPSPETRLKEYPHQLSGGMQQRVLIAIALACNPQLVIADEPTTALDVTIQAQILDLLKELRSRLGMAIILITHNMGVVAAMCDRMLVMYGGVVVEEGSCRTVFASPSHPYTKGLLASIPSVTEDRQRLYSIKGQVPVFSVPVSQCRFLDRCESCTERCRKEEPPLFSLPNGSKCRCWLMEERQGKEND